MISSGVYVNYDETKINVSQIQAIKFVNSSFNVVPGGFFDETLFTKLEKIDLSGVGLMTLDLKDVYVGNVYFVDIQHNNLKTIGINGTSPSSNNQNQIEIDNNNWNCVELLSIMSDLATLKIKFYESTKSTTINTTNIHGIKCTCSDDNHILKKLNHLIGKFDDYDVKDQKTKENIQNIKMEKMKSRFLEGNKEMGVEILISRQINEACNHSDATEKKILSVTSNMKEFLDKQSQVIFDSSIFKIVDASYGEIFQGHVNNDGVKINMSQIVKINFMNANFKELPEEFFNGSIFASLKTMNLSGVGLQQINLEKFSTMEVLDISNNELTSIEISEDFNKTKIESINLKKNYWSCSYLATLLESLSKLNIKQTEISQNEVHGCNILGIECFCSIGNQIDMKLNEISKVFKDQDRFHDLLLASFDNMQKVFLNMDTRFNENNLKMGSTILSIHNMGTTCNETANIDDKLFENIEQDVQLSSNSQKEKDIIVNVNVACQDLKLVRMKLKTKVHELAKIVYERWPIVPLSSSEEPSEASTLWVWIVIILTVVALIICVYLFYLYFTNQ
ncbi:unnamed protein product [Diamesa tonsa]